MKFGEVYKKYREQKMPYDECWFCTHIEDCKHPTVDNAGKPICPDECIRKDEIILVKRGT